MPKSFLRFVELQPTDKRITRVWEVQALDGTSLGHISWYGPWRKYCYTSPPGCQVTHDYKCLTEIGEFCLKRTEEHKG